MKSSLPAILWHHAPGWIGGLIGLAWFAHVADVRIINPVNLDWVLQGEYCGSP